MGIWLPQILQRRLVLHILQQVSILSNLDLSNLNISIGTNSKFSFSDITLYVNEIEIPNFDIVFGRLDKLDINLSVSSDLDIDGSGLTFIVKTLEDNFDIPFSLTKSIHDLATSLLQLTPDELFKESDITTEENRKYMDDLLNETSDNSSIKGSSEDNPDFKPSLTNLPNEKNAKIQVLAKIQIMKNRVLNSLLKKMKINLRKLRFCIQDKDGIPQYNIYLDKILITVMENNTRQILLNNFKISKLSPKEITQNDTGHSNMAKSTYYSNIDDTSIYMSALESSAEFATSARKEPSFANSSFRQDTNVKDTATANDINSGSLFNIEENFNECSLFEMDSMQITFDGIVNVNQLKISDLTIDIETITLHAHHILSLNDNVTKYLLNLLNIKMNSNNDNEDIESEAEISQFDSKNNSDILSFLFLKCFKIKFFPNDAIIFEHIYLNHMENEEIKLNFNNIKTEGDFLQIKTDKKPILKGTINSSNIYLELISQIDMKVPENRIPDAQKLVENINKFLSFVRIALNKNKNSLRVQGSQSTEPSRTLKVVADSISLTCTLQNYNLSLLFDPFVYDSGAGCLTTQKIKLLRTNKEDLNQILTLNNIKLFLFKGQEKYSSFDSLLENTVIYTQLAVHIESFNFNETYSRLKVLMDDINTIFQKLSNKEKDAKEKNKLECMKRSVRILTSSRVITKNISLASAIIKIGLIKCSLREVLKNTSFGVLKGKLTDCTVVFNAVDGSISFFVNSLELSRIFKRKKINEYLIRTLKFGSQVKPCIYLEYCSSDETNQLNFKLNGIEFNYRARWLAILRELRLSGQKQGINFKNATNTDASPSVQEKRNLKLSVTFLKTSILFFPYRINPAMVLFIDSLNTTSCDLSKFSIRSILKNCSIFLIDDFAKKKTLSTACSHSFKNYYINQGFCSIGTLKSWRIGMDKEKEIIKLTFEIDNANLLLCADSFHTFVQLCVDLKYPETFPENVRTQTTFTEDIDIFKNIDLNFFDRGTPMHSSTYKTNDFSNLFNIDEIISDDISISMRTKEGTVVLDKHNSGVDSSIVQESKSFNIQDDYIDSLCSSPKIKTNDLSKDTDEKVSINVSVNMNDIVIKLFDGYDWKHSRKMLADEIEQLQKDELDKKQKRGESKDSTPEENTEINVFNSIYITSNSTRNLKEEITRDLQDDSSQIKTDKLNLHPSLSHKVLLHLSNVNTVFINYDVDYPTFEESDHSADTLNKILLNVTTFEIIDNLSTSTWNKFVSVLRQEKWNVTKPMLELVLLMVRPLDYLPALEYIIKLNVAPLRFHIDQETLDFLIRFFGFKDPRFMLIDDYPETLFMQKISLNEIKMMIDYKPKKIDYVALKSGHAAELMNFFIIDGSTVILKEILFHGVNGFTELADKLKNVWAPDIAKRQIGGVLEGITPLKTFISLGSGVKTLVTVLMSDSKHKKRQIRGNFKSKSDIFLRTSTGEFVKLGVKITIGTQHILEQTEKILGGQGSKIRTSSYDDLINVDKIIDEDQLIGNNNVRINGKGPSALVIDAMDNRDGKPKLISLYADQPLDIHRGLEEAYHSLEKHMQVAYDTVWRQNKLSAVDTPSAAAISVAKVTPIAIIRPLIGATEAISKALQGLANQIDTEHLDEVHDKYKSYERK